MRGRGDALAYLPKPQELALLYGRAVNRQRKRLAELFRAYRAAGGTRQAHIEEEGYVGARESGPSLDGVAACRLAILERGELVELNVPALHIYFALNGANGAELGVFNQRQLDAVQVGELVARGVNRPEIGVALGVDHLVAEGVGEPPRREGGLFGV